VDSRFVNYLVNSSHHGTDKATSLD
jgi:hypothetical protein